MKQLDQWQGEFGNTYTDRNTLDWQLRVPSFKKIFEGLDISNVLEVGCNRGHNLVSLASFLPEETEIFGVEPNPHARKLARASSDRISAVRGTAYDIPFRDGFFDLVFTSGVLIHIPLADLPTALKEIGRVSGRYHLSLEYFAEEETTIPYRGHADLLWKRNFKKHYEDTIPGLRLLKTGDLGEEEGFDTVRYWLFEKSPKA
ncbi:MAG: pseudaminic acid biosynthesis-associated methylase [Chthoniobacterales bacterium]